MITLYRRISLISQLVLSKIPCYCRNESLSKCFIEKVHELTNNSYETRIKCITKKVTSGLFILKSRNPTFHELINNSYEMKIK